MPLMPDVWSLMTEAWCLKPDATDVPDATEAPDATDAAVINTDTNTNNLSHNSFFIYIEFNIFN